MTDTPNKTRFANLFLTGLLTLLPLWLTWIVLRFVFALMSDISRPWVGPILKSLAQASPHTLGWLSADWVQAAVALLGTVLVILLVGLLARQVIGQRLLRWFEGFIARIPLANTIYGSARKLLDILQKSPDGTQRVVLIDFPNPDMKAVGFVTKVIRERDTGRELAAVYVPTTPNPTSGYLEIVPLDKITPTDWSVDEAMSFIISGGAVSRDEIPFACKQ
ncbi:hypothetical protein CO608_04630 [Lysobacteraceae bacterium NML08-0793]|nr:hypothetical protein CO608_04630 [Xanthomonadaceae bacterium NML08-0793]